LQRFAFPLLASTRRRYAKHASAGLVFLSLTNFRAPLSSPGAQQMTLGARLLMKFEDNVSNKMGFYLRSIRQIDR
jgi:hypothetical protein